MLNEEAYDCVKRYVCVADADLCGQHSVGYIFRKTHQLTVQLLTDKSNLPTLVARI